MKGTCRKTSLTYEEKWRDFLQFKNWADENGYKDGLFLERISKKEGYTKVNLRFVVKDTSTKKRHGLYNKRIYKIWINMVSRCHNVNDTGYFDYGGKGITVCDDWKEDILPFYTWSMENGYSDNLTIDRISNEKGYSPDNCRWVTQRDQINNQERNIKIERNGEVKTLAQWADIVGIKYETLSSRYRKGLRDDELFEPLLTSSETVYYTFNGETKNLSEWSRRFGIDRGVVSQRYRDGIRGEDLFVDRLRRKHEYWVNINEKEYNLLQISEKFQITYDIVLNRYKKGLRGLDLIKKENDKEIYVEIEGQTKTLSEWAKCTEGITYSAISQRYYNGMRGKDLLFPNKKKKIEVEWLGELKSLNAWSKDKRIQVDSETLRKRYHAGKRGDELFSPSKNNKIELVYKGQRVDLKELSKLTGININTLRGRYKRGYINEDLYLK
jgi:hypothetical protein